jgi:hypothetical protein
LDEHLLTKFDKKKNMIQATKIIGVLLLLALKACNGLIALSWDNTGCDTSYGFCGFLEFCNGRGNVIYDYRVVGNPDCYIETAPMRRISPGKK